MTRRACYDSFVNSRFLIFWQIASPGDLHCLWLGWYSFAFQLHRRCSSDIGLIMLSIRNCSNAAIGFWLGGKLIMLKSDSCWWQLDLVPVVLSGWHVWCLFQDQMNHKHSQVFTNIHKALQYMHTRWCCMSGSSDVCPQLCFSSFAPTAWRTQSWSSGGRGLPADFPCYTAIQDFEGCRLSRLCRPCSFDMCSDTAPQGQTKLSQGALIFTIEPRNKRHWRNEEQYIGACHSGHSGLLTKI